MNPLSDAGAFQQQFHTGLANLLARPEPTPAQLVLVLANAVMLRDQSLLAQVRQAAASHLDAANDINAEPDEDVQILRYALNVADPFALIHRRTTAAGRQLQFNELRARRPKREATLLATTIHRPFAPDTFNFARIPDESFWQGTIQGQHLALYYNKYPFEPYHTSIVPEPQAGHEQFLRQVDHQLAWDLHAALVPHHPGLVLAYNSLGAYASINHLHFQMVPDGAHLPLLAAAGLKAPVPTTKHPSAALAWDHINHLQATNQPFNLIYTAGCTLVIERKFQGAYNQPDWNTGFAWYELAGGLIITDEHAYAALTDAAIEAALRQAAPEPHRSKGLQS